MLILKSKGVSGRSNQPCNLAVEDIGLDNWRDYLSIVIGIYRAGHDYLEACSLSSDRQLLEVKLESEIDFPVSEIGKI